MQSWRVQVARHRQRWCAGRRKTLLIIVACANATRQTNVKMRLRLQCHSMCECMCFVFALCTWYVLHVYRARVTTNTFIHFFSNYLKFASLHNAMINRCTRPRAHMSALACWTNSLLPLRHSTFSKKKNAANRKSNN